MASKRGKAATSQMGGNMKGRMVGNGSSTPQSAKGYKVRLSSGNARYGGGRIITKATGSPYKARLGKAGEG